MGVLFRLGDLRKQVTLELWVNCMTEHAQPYEDPSGGNYKWKDPEAEKGLECLRQKEVEYISRETGKWEPNQLWPCQP